ncbi:GAF domain-containing protein [Cytobacillus spongiae]|uniref:GAF domain-containing protein n=1 Tax=Cytobacillus spongiae TaxID=2901381 RepID=UPI001F328510|nr:GAF domain-containing protein [Cytobacillus spongiae]UII54788.1 GAF domain-containing protein [Cytobacillus spongiae]
MVEQERDTKQNYQVLLEAIDFFTQRFHLNQLFHYSLLFSTRMLQLDKAALFVYKPDGFLCTEQTSFAELVGRKVFVSQKFKELPLYNGRIITKEFTEYLPADFVEEYGIKLVVPIINDTELIGFIVTPTRTKGEFTETELTFADILMKLMNASFENNSRLLDFNQVKSDLDKKLFDLFVINQSTKALLSELDMKKLYSIATDVFSEISGSRVTSFSVYDELTKKVKVVGFKDVHSFKTNYTELTLNSQFFPEKVVLNVKKDQYILRELFVESERLEELQAEYVVLIMRNGIVGIVTLSESRSGEGYDSAIFELIETLASSTCIALNNAKLFQEISYQKELVEKKLKTLETYNVLSRTVNSCETEEELLSLSLQAIQLAFGVQQAFYAKKMNGHTYKISQAVGLYTTTNETIELKNDFYEELGDTFIQYQQTHLSDYFSGQITSEVRSTNGLIVSPISFRTRTDSLEEEPVYLLVIFSEDRALKHEDFLIIDTLTRNIRPILYQMNRVKDDKRKFLQAVEERMISSKLFGTENVFVYWQREHIHPFHDGASVVVDGKELQTYYRINGYVFFLENQLVEYDGWNIIHNPRELEDIIGHPYQ